MKKKAIKMSIILMLTLVFTLILTWWFSLTPLIGRDEIEKRLDRALSVDFEFVSSERKKNPHNKRSMIQYTYKDRNGLEFTVKSYKTKYYFYASDTGFWWYNGIGCDYKEMFMAQYKSHMIELCGNMWPENVGEHATTPHINIYRYEQLVEVADIIAEIYAEIPRYPVNESEYRRLFDYTSSAFEGFIVWFRFGEDSTVLGIFDDLPYKNTNTPKSDYFLEKMEKGLADAIRRYPNIKDYIDMDALPQRVLDMAGDEG